MASAHRQVRLDPEDTDGPVDIVVSRVRHHHGKYRFRVVTHDRWRTRQLAGSSNFISFEIDADGDGDRELCAVASPYEVSEDVYELQARLYGNSSGCNYFTDGWHGDLKVWRTNRRSVTVVVPLTKAPELAADFRWRATSAFDRKEHAKCPSPEPHADGGYGTCTDLTKARQHTSN